MRARMRQICLCLATIAVLGADARAQATKANVVEIPELAIKFAPYQTLEPSSDGTTFRVGLLTQMGSVPLTLMEGWCLLTMRAEGSELPKNLVKAQIVEVDTPNSVKIKVDKAGGALIKPGVTFGLLRPPGVTTAQIKALPGVIPIAGVAEPKPVAGTLSSVELARMAAQRVQSTNNLKQMGLALHNYYSAYDQFPPAVIYGPDGKPWHSWRVLILPFLEQVDAYNAYDFREPWDSPKNIKLLDKMPAVYRDPIHGDAKGTDTHYAALVGQWSVGNYKVNTILQPSSVRPGIDPSKGTVLSDPRGSKMQSITDGTSNTVMVTSVAPERKIPWTKPEDIVVDQNFPGMGKPAGIATPYLAGNRVSGPKAAPFLFGDGSVRMFNDQMPLVTIKALLTRDGGEVVNFDQAGRGNSPTGSFGAPKKVKLYLDGARARAVIE